VCLLRGTSWVFIYNLGYFCSAEQLIQTPTAERRRFSSLLPLDFCFHQLFKIPLNYCVCILLRVELTIFLCLKDFLYVKVHCSFATFNNVALLPNTSQQFSPPYMIMSTTVHIQLLRIFQQTCCIFCKCSRWLLLFQCSLYTPLPLDGTAACFP